MPWHYCSKNTDSLTLLWGGSSRGASSRFRKLLSSLPRPHPDPQLEWHLQLYDQYSKLKQGLEKRKRSPLLTDRDLKRLDIVHGAPLNVDDFHPIDVEKRFFLAKRSRCNWAKKLARRFLERGRQWSELNEKTRWGRAESRDRIRNDRYKNYYLRTLWGMIEWSDDALTWARNPWWAHSESDYAFDDPTQATIREKVYRGRTKKLHEFEALYTLHYRDRTKHGPGPSVPHLVIITYDTFVPDAHISRSEVLLAVSILRSHLALHPWLEHHTFPILVLSFHETGARVLQMHAENKQFVVRVSRPLEFQTNDGSIPNDALVMLTWMLAAPMGDTGFSALPKPIDDAKSCQNGDLEPASMLRIPAIAPD